MILGITYTSWIGYLASGIIILSFMMKSIQNLRTINSIGAFVFIVYGVLLDMAWPIIITNTFILGLNIYYLKFKNSSD